MANKDWTLEYVGEDLGVSRRTLIESYKKDPAQIRFIRKIGKKYVVLNEAYDNWKKGLI